MCRSCRALRGHWERHPTPVLIPVSSGDTPVAGWVGRPVPLHQVGVEGARRVEVGATIIGALWHVEGAWRVRHPADPYGAPTVPYTHAPDALAALLAQHTRLTNGSGAAGNIGPVALPALTASPV